MRAGGQLRAIGGFRTFTESAHTPSHMDMFVITESLQKLRAWYRAIHLMGFRPSGLLTVGFVREYPGDLDLLGFRFDEAGVREFGRLPRGQFIKRFQRKLESLRADTTILIATDNDQEGDVIAFDVAQMIQEHDPSLFSHTCKVCAGSMDPRDLRAAAEEAIAQARRAPAEARGLFARMQRAAVPGRARAVLDRWIGGAYSHDTGAPCGRVKAAALGAVRLWNERPEALRAIPETGEIRLRAAAADGGAAFTARIPLRGPVPSELESLLAWHQGAYVPGRIVTARPAGAAVAPRDGRAPLFNTGDVLIAAARDYGLSVMATMKGLHFSYLHGRLSYPRTAERHVSEATARWMVEFAQKCGIPGLPDSPQEWSAPAPVEGPHDALHPTRGHWTGDVAAHFSAEQPRKRRPANIAAGIVSERCFEAMRHNPLSWGSYRPDPQSSLSQAQIATLEDLVWTRSEAEPLHAADPPMTELRWWPMDSIMVDLMMSEGIGRPSTWASHSHALAVSDWLEPGRDGRPPTLSPKGHIILSRLPPEAADPETSRHIQRILDDAPCGPDGALNAPLPQVIAQRIDAVRTAYEGIDARLRAEMRRDDARMARAHHCRDEAQARPHDKTFAAMVQIADAAAALGLCSAQGGGGALGGSAEDGAAGAAQGGADSATALAPHVAQSRRAGTAVLAAWKRDRLAERGAAETNAAQGGAAKTKAAQGGAAPAPEGTEATGALRDDAANMHGPTPLAADPGPLPVPDGATAEAQDEWLGAAQQEDGSGESHGGAPSEEPDDWPDDPAQASVGTEGDPPDAAPPQDTALSQDRADEAQGAALNEAGDDQHGGAPIEEPDHRPGDAEQAPIGTRVDPPDTAPQQNTAPPQNRADEAQGAALIEAHDNQHGGAPIEEARTTGRTQRRRPPLKPMPNRRTRHRPRTWRRHRIGPTRRRARRSLRRGTISTAARPSRSRTTGRTLRRMPRSTLRTIRRAL